MCKLCKIYIPNLGFILIYIMTKYLTYFTHFYITHITHIAHVTPLIQIFFSSIYYLYYSTSVLNIYILYDVRAYDIDIGV